MKWIIVAPRFLNLISRGFARAMVLYPFILLSKEEDRYDIQLIRHEQIHVYQQLELLVIGFYLWYLIEYLLYRLRGHSHQDAYYRLSMEKEARDLACNLDRKRKLFGFVKYL